MFIDVYLLYRNSNNNLKRNIMTTQIEKTWNIEINGYTFSIQRNKRKDVFLSKIITDTKNKGFIGTRRHYFITLKGAKKHALEMINEYEKHFNIK